MPNRKKRIICLIMAICILFFGCLFSEDKKAKAFGTGEVSSTYNAQITQYGERHVNGEICTARMLGTGNITALVRGPKRVINQSYLKISHFLSLCPDFDPDISDTESALRPEERITSFTNAVILKYIHHQDGQK